MAPTTHRPWHTNRNCVRRDGRVGLVPRRALPGHVQPGDRALAGVAALALQNSVDFSLELLGVAIPLAIVLGVIGRVQAPLSLAPTTIRSAAVFLACCGAIGMALWIRHPTEAESQIAGEPLLPPRPYRLPSTGSVGTLRTFSRRPLPEFA